MHDAAQRTSDSSGAWPEPFRQRPRLFVPDLAAERTDPTVDAASPQASPSEGTSPEAAPSEAAPPKAARPKAASPEVASPKAAPSEAVDAGRRLHALIAAQRTIASDRPLPEMLRDLLITACEVLAAQSGVLHVHASLGMPALTVAHGNDAPRSCGLCAVGTATEDGADKDGADKDGADKDGADEDGAGSAIGAARATIISHLDVRGDRVGTLALHASTDHLLNTDELSPDDRSTDDEEFVAALASMAASAVGTAQLHEDARRSRDWLSASGEITRALLADADADALLKVVSRALRVADADYGSLVLPVSGGRLLRVTVAVGVGADSTRGMLLDPVTSPMSRIISNGESLLVADIMSVASPDFENVNRYGPVMIVPLVDVRGVRGAVVVVRTAGRPQFTARDLELATTFADQVALALELDDARTDSEQLRVLEVRHRIAEDLHDSVIQRLFATGMGLQGLARSAVPAALSDRLGRHINDLDETIDEIRERVFGLRESASGTRERARDRFPHVPREDDPPA